MQVLITIAAVIGSISVLYSIADILGLFPWSYNYGAWKWQKRKK